MRPELLYLISFWVGEQQIRCGVGPSADPFNARVCSALKQLIIEEDDIV